MSISIKLLHLLQRQQINNLGLGSAVGGKGEGEKSAIEG